MKNKAKNFWEKRAAELLLNENSELGIWQSTSLTSSEEEALKRRNLEIEHLEKALELLPSISEMNLLEIGCGVGRLTTFFAQKFSHVYATDYIADFLAIASQKAEEENLKNITFRHLESDQALPEWKVNCRAICGVLSYLNDDDYFKTLSSAKNAEYLIIKESVGVNERLELEDHFSEQLNCNYNAIYRQKDELIKDVQNLGYNLIMDNLVEAHREETNIRIFVFKK
jgi:SAM-dependent methyltransferase